ncbi:MAG: hypothetical protein FJ144_16385 [Deltaproteobacteria bacterium]|nr:hypothetical protein [Deltaproteobacteria bacterium]
MLGRRNSFAPAMLLAAALGTAAIASRPVDAGAAVVCQTPASEALQVRHETGCTATEVELPIEVVTVTVSALAAPAEPREGEQHGGSESSERSDYGPR